MSNDLVSQQLPVSDRQIEHVPDKADSSAFRMQMGAMGFLPSNAKLDQFVSSNQQKGSVDLVSCAPHFPTSNMRMEQIEPVMGKLGSKILMQDEKFGDMEASWNNIGPQKSLLPVKRKAEVESASNNSLSSPAPNKRVVHIEPPLSSPQLLQASSFSKRSGQILSLPSTTGLLNQPSKKMVRNESISNKSSSQRIQTPKNRTASVGQSPKGQTESSEAVRSKMRESLASAWDVVSQLKEKASNEERSPLQPHVDAQGAERSFADKPIGMGSTREASVNDGVVQMDGHEQESHFKYVLPDADGSFSDNFFVKDELLQGNGLSWAWDMGVDETTQLKIDEKPKLVALDAQGDNTEQQVVNSAQVLASRIELELFKLFGGVNKKYREKGRSLIFNLKDRNNPELRERVMSGEISPERLCSMTPEELASKELSQWRMAKAEELDQLKVLPDTDVDIRRLVKKTHKGEYQVEVEQDDGISVEVSVGSTSFTHFWPKQETGGAHPLSEGNEEVIKENTDGEKKSSLENQDDTSCSLTIPTDGTDLMQGLIVEELKDAELLPPIVSLDEFMESLNSEPPFENLQVDARQMKPLEEKEKSESIDKAVASDPTSTSAVVAKADRVTYPERKKTKVEVNLTTTLSPAGRKASPIHHANATEIVWEGELQLAISSSVKVIGLFRSGEKTSAKEWPSSVEIKGRVRLDAFEKFLQELPMSRSRAVMVVHFALKEGSPEHSRVGLSEAVNSYVMDERLGYGEPVPGVEIYFCPPHQPILNMLNRNLSKPLNENFDSFENGLIGVVIWRRPQLTISPSHKHTSKKHFSYHKQEEDTKIYNPSLSTMTKSAKPFVQQPHVADLLLMPKSDDDDGDIPPGFGPGPARDEDDLPEFNFSASLNQAGQKSPLTTRAGRPIDHVRELIQKYGQTGSTSVNQNHQGDQMQLGAERKSWSDDDDDIPEWQPDMSQNYRPSPSITGQLVNHPTHGVQVGLNPLEIRPGVTSSTRLVQSRAGQHHSVGWRQGTPRSRGL